MWETVELREIRVFLTVADELHFRRAAERLGLTPSRVSQTLRALEARVGGPLFHRTSRRVSLTPVGERFLSDIAPAYERMHDAFVATREAATGVAGTLRLGMYTPVNGGPHLREIVRGFEERYPQCSVHVIDTGLQRDQAEWLRRGEVDLLAMRLPFSDPGVIIGPVLSREQRVLIVADDHPLADRPSVSFEDLADYTVPDISALPRELMDAFIPPLTPSGRRLHRAELHSLPEAISRAATGEIVHPTVPSFLDHYRSPGVTAVPIRGMPASETALVWLRANRSVKIDAFTRTASEILQRHEVGR
jgi:DNA-binding transcriptional LysR family regulator